MSERSEKVFKHFNEQRAAFEARVEEGIERYRKGDAVISVIDGDGKPVEATVEVEQTSHAFRFGANIFMLDEFETEEKNRIYREKFSEIFNLATVPFYWKDLEPEDGKPRFAKDSPKVYRRPAPDLCLAYCEERGIEPKCHCLNYDNFAPDWAKGMTVGEYKARLDRRFREIAERYADKIPSFEVTNETFWAWDPASHTKFYFEPDFVEWSFDTAEKYFRNNRLIINDFELFGGETYTTRTPYYMQVRDLLKAGKHLDSLGMQYHSFVSREGEEKFGDRRYNPEKMWRLLDLYATLGKKIQITEMTLPAYSTDLDDEEVQAQLFRETYRMFFSHPAMEAIIYWNVVDGYAAFAPQGDMTAGENKFAGGLFRFDMSEKPAFRTLRKLIREEWHTSATVRTIAGDAAFRGFFGDYRVRVTANGKTVEKTFTLKEGDENRLTVTL